MFLVTVSLFIFMAKSLKIKIGRLNILEYSEDIKNEPVNHPQPRPPPSPKPRPRPRPFPPRPGPGNPTPPPTP
jgi:hypothetical protein